MEKIGIIGIFICVTLITFIIYQRSSNPRINGFSVGTFIIENKKKTLMIADTSDKWTRGLMNIREKPAGVDGMIFLFPDYEDHTFWNQDTYLDLKLLWYQDDKKVGETRLPSIQKTGKPLTVESPAKVNRVVELIQ